MHPLSQTDVEINSQAENPLWMAGIRYSDNLEIWCAYSSGEPAWTLEKKLAARFQDESSAK